MDIVDNQDIDPHIIGHEIRQFVLMDGVHVLGLELVASHVKDNKIRVSVVDGDTDRLREVGFAQAGTSENEQRIERRLARLLGDVDSGVDAHLVTLPFHQVVKAISGIQPGIDLYFLETRKNEGARITRGLEGVKRNSLVLRDIPVRSAENHGRFRADRVDPVHQLGVRSDNPPESHLYDREIGVLKVTAEEISGDLYSQSGFLQGDRNNGLEPYVELLGIHVLLEDPKTLVPH